MALSKSFKSPQGFDVENGYFRVEEVSIRNKTVLEFVVRSYKSKDESVAITSAVHSMACVIENKNPFEQAYQYLKTTPEFSDAADC